jgi:tungstate transport system ATP-binding protein
MSQETVVLSVKNLLVQRGKVTISVPEVSLTPGQIFAIMGPNGAGKSSAVLAMALLIKAKWDEFKFRDEDVTHASALNLRRRMAVVFQEPLLLDTTVIKNVMLGLTLRGEHNDTAGDRALHWLDRMSIKHLADRRAHSLSGGEAQRVSIARGLVLSPDVLFMDEPFSGIDVLSRLSLLKEMVPLLAENRIAGVLVTHDFGEALLLASRMIVMEAGNTVQSGTPFDVLDAPATPVARAMVEFAGTIAGLVDKRREHDS